MFKNALFFIAITLGVVFQISLLPEIFTRGAVPNLILTVVIYWAIKYDFSEALPKIILIGMIYDIFSFYPVGSNIVAFLTVAFMVNSLTKRLAVSQWSFNIGIIILSVFGTVINDSVLWLISEGFGHIREDYFYTAGDFFSLSFILKIVFNIILLIITRPIFEKIEKIARLYFNKKIIVK